MTVFGNIASYVEEDGFVGGLLGQYAEDAANSMGYEVTAPWSESLVRKITEIISGKDPNIKPNPMVQKVVGTVGSGIFRGASGAIPWETLVPRSKFGTGKDGDREHRNAARLVREMFQEAGRGAGDAIKDAAKVKAPVPTGGFLGGRAIAWNPLFGKVGHTADAETGVILCVDAIMAETLQSYRVAAHKAKTQLGHRGRAALPADALDLPDPGWTMITEQDAATQGIALCPHCAHLSRGGKDAKTATSQLSEEAMITLGAVLNELESTGQRNDMAVIKTALVKIAVSPKDVQRLETALAAVETEPKRIRKDGQVKHLVGVSNPEMVSLVVSLCSLFGGEGDNTLQIRDLIDQIVDGNAWADRAHKFGDWASDRAPVWVNQAKWIVYGLTAVIVVGITIWGIGWYIGSPAIFNAGALLLAGTFLIVGFTFQWISDQLAALWRNGTWIARALVAQLENLIKGLGEAPTSPEQHIRKVAFSAFVGVTVYTFLVNFVMREEVWFGLEGVATEGRWAAAMSLLAALVYTIAPDSWRDKMQPPDWAKRFMMSTTVSTSEWFRRLGKLTAFMTLLVVPIVYGLGELGVAQLTSPNYTMNGVVEDGVSHVYLPDGKKVKASETPLASSFDSGQAWIDNSKVGNGRVKVRPGTVVMGNPTDGYTYRVKRNGRVKVLDVELDGMPTGVATVTSSKTPSGKVASATGTRDEGFMAKVGRKTGLPAWVSLICIAFAVLTMLGFLIFLFGSKDGPKPARGMTMAILSLVFTLILLALIGVSSLGTAIWGKDEPATVTYVTTSPAASTVGAGSTKTTGTTPSASADDEVDAAIRDLERLVEGS